MLKPTVSSQFPPFGGGPVRFKNNHLKLLWANIKTLCHIGTIYEASSNQVPRHLVVLQPQLSDNLSHDFNHPNWFQMMLSP